MVISIARVQIQVRFFLYGWSSAGVRLQIWVCVWSASHFALCKFGCGFKEGKRKDKKRERKRVKRGVKESKGETNGREK